MPWTPAAITSPIPTWKKMLSTWERVAVGAYDALYDVTFRTDTDAETEWRKVVLKFDRVQPSGLSDDSALIAFHIQNWTSGHPDASWTTTDYTQCEAALDEFMTSMQFWYGITHTFKGYWWYRMNFAEDMDVGGVAKPDSKRFAFTGPPTRVTPKTQAGTASGVSLPYQCALTITLQTAAPHHWGRVYFPGIATSMLETSADIGRYDDAKIQGIANAAAELVDDLNTNQLFLVIPTTQTNKVLGGKLQTVSGVQVDDIPDIIRRRRARNPAYRKVGAPTP